MHSLPPVLDHGKVCCKGPEGFGALVMRRAAVDKRRKLAMTTTFESQSTSRGPGPGPGD